MNAYSAADLEYKIATFASGAYPRASAIDPSYPFFYGHDYDLKLHIFDIWSGAKLETAVITRRGDTSVASFGVAPGSVFLCLESGAYLVDLKIAEGTWSKGWTLESLPEVIARVGMPWEFHPKLVGKHDARWVLESSPADLKIDVKTGAMQWTPTKDQVGRHSSLLRVELPEDTSDSPIRQPVIIHVVP